jgi:hypothetical protein
MDIYWWLASKGQVMLLQMYKWLLDIQNNFLDMYGYIAQLYEFSKKFKKISRHVYWDQEKLFTK